MIANPHGESPSGVADRYPTKSTPTASRPSARPKLVAHLRRMGRRRPVPVDGSGGGPTHKAAAALPHRNRGRATERLRDQLTIMARAAGLAPDWTTLAVTGPTEMTGAQHGARYEWTGRVAMRGSSSLMPLTDPDDFLQHAAADGDTVAFRVDSYWNRPRPEPTDSPQPPHRPIATRAAA